MRTCVALCVVGVAVVAPIGWTGEGPREVAATEAAELRGGLTPSSVCVNLEDPAMYLSCDYQYATTWNGNPAVINCVGGALYREVCKYTSSQTGIVCGTNSGTCDGMPWVSNGAIPPLAVPLINESCWAPRTTIYTNCGSCSDPIYSSDAPPP